MVQPRLQHLGVFDELSRINRGPHPRLSRCWPARTASRSALPEPVLAAALLRHRHRLVRRRRCGHRALGLRVPSRACQHRRRTGAAPPALVLVSPPRLSTPPRPPGAGRGRVSAFRPNFVGGRVPLRLRVFPRPPPHPPPRPPGKLPQAPPLNARARGVRPPP